MVVFLCIGVFTTLVAVVSLMFLKGSCTAVFFFSSFWWFLGSSFYIFIPIIIYSLGLDTSGQGLNAACRQRLYYLKNTILIPSRGEPLQPLQPDPCIISYLPLYRLWLWTFPLKRHCAVCDTGTTWSKNWTRHHTRVCMNYHEHIRKGFCFKSQTNVSEKNIKCW